MASEAMTGLAAVDATTLSGVEVLELVVASQRLRSMADAVCVRAAGALEASGAWAPEGARSASAWMQWRCRIPAGRAVTALRCARALRGMPATEAAFLAGAITVEHVQRLVDAHRLSAEAFAASEAKLVHLASTLRVRQFDTALTYWAQLHEPDQVEDRAQALVDQRAAHVSATFEGVVVLNALLDPVSGAIVLRELQRIEQALFEADWAAARAEHGDRACGADLVRTPQQRRADALRVMAERSATKPPGAVEARVLLQVLVGEAALGRICELSNGRVLTPGQTIGLLDRADLERIVFDGPSKVIDVGVRRRLFTGATRTAVQVRDRGCTHPSCDMPLDRCEIDHITPYDAGGQTIQSNGQCHCEFHNRRKGRQPPPTA